jgi:hypothetical protein
MFGKCEICFRAGHCSISQCKDQERNEEEVIQRVINTAQLTAKVSPNLLANTYEADPKAVLEVVNVNRQVEAALHRDLNSAVRTKSAGRVIPEVQNLVKTYFSSPTAPVNASAKVVLHGKPVPLSAANISFWNDQSAKAAAHAAQTKQVVEKINQQVEKIKKLKQEAKGDKTVNKVIHQQQKELRKMTAKVNRLSNKLQSNQKSLKQLAKNPKITDANTKSAVQNSLNQIKQVKSVVKQAKSNLVKDRKQLAKRN